VQKFKATRTFVELHVLGLHYNSALSECVCLKELVWEWYSTKIKNEKQLHTRIWDYTKRFEKIEFALLFMFI
jgi:hypothetical protein